MLQAWASIGYLVLIAIGLLAVILWRGGSPVLAIAALVVGVPLWFGWEYARPTWTTGLITGTEVRRSDPDSRGRTTDIEYIYMRNRSDRGMELINDDSWWWLKRNSERVFNDAKTAQDRNTEMTLQWNRWRSTLLSKYPNAIAIGRAGSWPLWSVRTIVFYGLSSCCGWGFSTRSSGCGGRVRGRGDGGADECFALCRFCLSFGGVKCTLFPRSRPSPVLAAAQPSPAYHRAGCIRCDPFSRGQEDADRQQSGADKKALGNKGIRITIESVTGPVNGPK